MPPSLVKARRKLAWETEEARFGIAGSFGQLLLYQRVSRRRAKEQSRWCRWQVSLAPNARSEQGQTRRLTLHLQVHLAHLGEAVPQVHWQLLNHCQRESPSEGRGQRRKYAHTSLRACVRTCVRRGGRGSRQPTARLPVTVRKKHPPPPPPSRHPASPSTPALARPQVPKSGPPVPPTHFPDSPLGTTSRPSELGERGGPRVYLCHSLSPEFCPFQYGASASSARSASAEKKKKEKKKPLWLLTALASPPPGAVIGWLKH